MSFDTIASVTPLTPNGGIAFTPTMEFGGSTDGFAYSRQEGSIYHIAPGLAYLRVRLTLSARGTNTGEAQVRIPESALRLFNGGDAMAIFMQSGAVGTSILSARTVADSRTIWPFIDDAFVRRMARADFTDTTDLIISGVVRTQL